MNVNGKKVIVTGGASGIGKSLVEKLFAEKAIVGVFDVDKYALKTLKAEMPAADGFFCDVSNDRQVEKIVEGFFSKYGAIDILVNNAGIVSDAPLFGFKKHDVKIWHKVIETNLSSVFYVARHVVEKMFKTRTKGLIINVSSISASGNPGQSAYSAAKAGVNALTRTWAKELGNFGIRVAGVAPGFTKTKLITSSLSEKNIKIWEERTPLGRMAHPDEIAEAILFIIHDDYYHGKILEIDGGLIL